MRKKERKNDFNCRQRQLVTLIYIVKTAFVVADEYKAKKLYCCKRSSTTIIALNWILCLFLLNKLGFCIKWRCLCTSTHTYRTHVSHSALLILHLETTVHNAHSNMLPLVYIFVATQAHMQPIHFRLYVLYVQFLL